MKKRHTRLVVTLSAAAHIDLEVDTFIGIESCDIRKMIPVDPKLGIGQTVIFLKNGSSLNVIQTVEQLFSCFKNVDRSSYWLRN